MATVTATKAFSDIRDHAESIKNDGDHRVEVCTPGDTWAQGDVGIVCIADLPRDAVLVKEPQVQLAPGTTQGSRHCLDSLRGIKVYSTPNDGPLDGPLLKSSREFTVEHPEHGNVTLPAGCYAIVYQRAFADELRAVRD